MSCDREHEIGFRQHSQVQRGKGDCGSTEAPQQPNVQGACILRCCCFCCFAECTRMHTHTCLTARACFCPRAASMASWERLLGCCCTMSPSEMLPDGGREGRREEGGGRRREVRKMHTCVGMVRISSIGIFTPLCQRNPDPHYPPAAWLLACPACCRLRSQSRPAEHSWNRTCPCTRPPAGGLV